MGEEKDEKKRTQRGNQKVRGKKRRNKKERD